MLSISKYEMCLKLNNSMKRLQVFSSITGNETEEKVTRNIKFAGIDPETNLEVLQCMLEEFGKLHVFDTQQIAQKSFIVSFYDIRNAKSAFTYFSSLYKLSYLQDPPFEEFSDILIIYTEPSYASAINDIFSQGSSMSVKISNSFLFHYYDLRIV